MLQRKGDVLDWTARELQWRPDGWTSRRSTLWMGERAIARFQVDGWLGTRALLEHGSSTWRLHRKNFWGRREVMFEGYGPLARLDYEPGWWGRGSVRSDANRDLEMAWRLVRFWRSTWAWQRGSEPLIRFERRSLLHSRGFTVSIEPEAREWPELLGLLGLGWWLLLDGRRRSTS